MFWYADIGLWIDKIGVLDTVSLCADIVDFAAPGIWGAMNSLGAGGAASPQRINAANPLTFCLIVVSCYFSTVIVHYIGIKGAVIFGTYGQSQIRSGTSSLTIVKCRLGPIYLYTWRPSTMHHLVLAHRIVTF